MVGLPRERYAMTAAIEQFKKETWTKEGELRRQRFETLDEFLARVESAGPPAMLLGDLLPDDGFAAWHGRPRSMKTLGAQEALVALATRTPAYGDPRFAVHEAVPGLYLTEEDAERITAFRFRLLLNGRGLKSAPLLKVKCRPGWNLSDARDQAEIFEAIKEHDGARLLVVDPVRGSFPNIDKGPADAAPDVRFLRSITRETSVRSILLVHHDTKPSRDGKDERARAERSSGGIIFSIADAPVNFERVDDRTCYCVPSCYKIGADPKPFRVTFESGSPAGEPFRDFLRPKATTVEENAELGLRAEAAVLRVMDDADDWLPRAAVLEAVKARAADVVKALAALESAGRVTMRPGPKHSKEYRRGLIQ